MQNWPNILQNVKRETKGKENDANCCNRALKTSLADAARPPAARGKCRNSAMLCLARIQHLYISETGKLTFILTIR
jgi:hypothetical protein